MGDSALVDLRRRLQLPELLMTTGLGMEEALQALVRQQHTVVEVAGRPAGC